jgi:hypothetical protein
MGAALTDATGSTDSTRSTRWHPWVVPGAAVAAFLLRLPWLAWPMSSDEAGFTLVARAWAPTGESLYGPYFVDRPPPLIAVFGIADLLGPPMGTPTGIRLLGALAAAATVVLVARAALLVATPSAARWSAVLVAALVTTPLIDAMSTKGELLALPLIAASMWAALRAVRSAGRHPFLAAAVAGAAGALALGMKQNLVDGLVFAAVLVVASRLNGDLTWRRTLRVGAGMAAGAAVPVLVVVGATLLAGVGLDTLWYALYGFRADAAEVLAETDSHATYQRLWLLVAAALGAGVVAVIGGFVLHLRQEWRADRPATAAVTAMLLVEIVGLIAGGSYWRDYLFPLIPSVGLALALLARDRDRVGARARMAVTFTVAATGLAIVGFAGAAVLGALPDERRVVGQALAAASRPGDTLVVFGGKADIQVAAGLDSPYPHLWSLPMRTLDPEHADLTAVLRGAEAPTWLVAWVPFDTWSADAGARVEEVVAERYAVHGECEGAEIYLLEGTVRPPLDCG